MTVPAGSVISLGPNKLADLLTGALESELSSACLLEQPVEMAAHRNSGIPDPQSRARSFGYWLGADDFLRVGRGCILGIPPGQGI